MTDNTVGKNIKSYRLSFGFTQDRLAEKLCMKRQTLSNYEIGKRIPDVYILSEMADIFETSLDNLVGRDK